MKTFWRFVWELSEFFGIGLGKHAPFVFERMIGVKGERVVGVDMGNGSDHSCEVTGFRKEDGRLEITSVAHSPKRTRKEQYIKANIEIGGKIICLHDWTYLGVNADFLDPVTVGCVKCGATNATSSIPVEPIE